jgi:hypothetical protein
MSENEQRELRLVLEYMLKQGEAEVGLNASGEIMYRATPKLLETLKRSHDKDRKK